MRALVTKRYRSSIELPTKKTWQTPDTSTLLVQGQGKKQDVPLPVGMENAHPWLCGQVAGCLASAFGWGTRVAEVFWKIDHSSYARAGSGFFNHESCKATRDLGYSLGIDAVYFF